MSARQDSLAYLGLPARVAPISRPRSANLSLNVARVSRISIFIIPITHILHAAFYPLLYFISISFLFFISTRDRFEILATHGGRRNNSILSTTLNAAC